MTSPIELIESFENTRERTRQSIMMLALERPIALGELLDFFIRRRVGSELLLQRSSYPCDPLIVGGCRSSTRESVACTLEKKTDSIDECSIEIEQHGNRSLRHEVKLTCDWE